MTLNNVQQGNIDAIAIQYGIPTSIWQDIATVESGNNPQAIGDNGTSFGLFQLHIGGQLPAQYNNNPTAVFDPVLNAQIAMPSIATAWNNLKSSFNPSSTLWWQQFAAQSGHPGGTPGNQITDNEAAKLQAGYLSGPNDIGNGIVAGGITSQTGSVGAGIQSANISNTILTNLESGFLPAFERIAIFIVAIILIIIGFIVVTK